MLKWNEIKHNKIEEDKTIRVCVGNIFSRIKLSGKKMKNEINKLKNNKREKEKRQNKHKGAR